MRAVILTGTVGVELLVVELAQLLTTVRVLPDPLGERLLDECLLALCNRRFRSVQHSRAPSISILNVVEDFYIPQVQRLLNDLVGIDSSSAVSAVGLDIAAVVGFVLNVPFAGVLRVANLDVPLAII